MLTKLGYHLLLEASHDSYIWNQVSLLSFPMHFAYFCITALITSNCPCEFTCPFLLLYQVSWGLGMNTQDMYYGWHIKCLNNKLIDGLIKDNNHLFNTLPQRLATFFVKDQTVNILGFVNHMVSVTTTLLHQCGVKAAIDNKQMMGMAVFLYNFTYRY